jgi:hypothetical protein
VVSMVAMLGEIKLQLVHAPSPSRSCPIRCCPRMSLDWEF